jgi:chemotaxis methyl-accepting protein methylase
MNDTQPVINNNEELLPPGDAFIVYPDRARKSVFSSMRFEAMRDGIEDYELLEKLRDKNPAEAERLCRTAISSFTDYVRNPATFREIERDLLEALSK